MHAALLLLADGRFPSGGHAHSAGTEPAVGAGEVHDMTSLRAFVEGRLATGGVVDAAFAAASCARASRVDPQWTVLDAEYIARTASPRLRQISRTLGRQLLRGGERAWPSAAFGAVRRALADGVPQPIAMGVVAHAFGASPADAALCELHHLVGSLASGAVRLLGLDPFDIAAFNAQLAPQLDRLAIDAGDHAHDEPAMLPASVGLLNDVLAEHHGTWEVRLFAS